MKHTYIIYGVECMYVVVERILAPLRSLEFFAASSMDLVIYCIIQFLCQELRSSWPLRSEQW
jgi:hypothetical protein